MKNIKQKRGSGGFTLAELLIVVAIIGILVAVSIPVFTAQLEKTKENTDISNLRSAKAAAVAKYMGANGEFSKTGDKYYYDAENGVLITELKNINGYGKGTEKDGGCENFNMFVRCDEDHMDNEKTYKPDTESAGKVIEVTIESCGCIYMDWVKATKTV